MAWRLVRLSFSACQRQEVDRGCATKGIARLSWPQPRTGKIFGTICLFASLLHRRFGACIWTFIDAVVLIGDPNSTAPKYLKS